MQCEPLGDAAFILRNFQPLPAWELAERLRQLAPPGLIDVAPSYDCVGVFVDPDAFDPESLFAALESGSAVSRVLRPHVIPCCYDMGPDLAECARELGMAQDDVVLLHSSATFTCAAIGFCPGFPYLTGLPPALCGLPRLPSPRPRIEPGMVAIVEDQAGIYPMVRPGGWRLIGRTPLLLVNPDEDYFPIAPGDEVQFRPIDSDEFVRLEGTRL